MLEIWNELCLVLDIADLLNHCSMIYMTYVLKIVIGTMMDYRINHFLHIIQFLHYSLSHSIIMAEPGKVLTNVNL